jgi:hypothetical protein
MLAKKNSHFSASASSIRIELQHVLQNEYDVGRGCAEYDLQRLRIHGIEFNKIGQKFNVLNFLEKIE